MSQPLVFLQDQVAILKNINKECNLQLKEARVEIQNLKLDALMHQKRADDLESFLRTHMYNRKLEYNIMWNYW